MTSRAELPDSGAAVTLETVLMRSTRPQIPKQDVTQADVSHEVHAIT